MATQVTLNDGSIDSAGSLSLKTNGTTTAVTINTSQGVEFNAGTAAAPSITKTGDTNTGIFFPAADTIAFSEGGAEAMRIDSSGNVGIGTNSPQRKLQSSAGADDNCILATSAAGNAYIGFADNATTSQTGLSVRMGSAGNAMVFQTGGTTERMRIDSSGNLLVGATSTVNSERLRVDANITSFGTRLLNSNANPQGVTVGFSGAAPNGTGNPFIACGDTATDRFIARSNGGLANYSANNFNLASDLRLKHDIEPVQSYWNVFKSIEWKTWLYNDQTDEIKNIGVIAQELQALAPELVCESNALPTPEGESPYLGLWENDFKMAGMSVITELVKRCEEQQAIIQTLTDRITALEQA